MIELSVVLGTYNRLHMLMRCLPKILSSGASLQMEVIINDGGSTDGTVEYLKKMAANNKRIVLILHDKPDGVTKAYNECFQKASGKYITWMSDDTIPIGDSLFQMCRLMKALSPKDMGAFMFRQSAKSSFGISKIRGFLCPEVSCVYTETLRKMNGWNTDYPYYGQDNEFDARILRMGGRIVGCRNAFLEHLNHQDMLKKSNLDKYRAQGHAQKFQIIYFHRYGIPSAYEYPVLGIAPLPGVSEQRVLDTIKRIHGHYKNMNYHLFASAHSSSISSSIEYVKEIPWENAPNWNKFDLVAVIGVNSKQLYSGNGMEITKDFARELLK